MRPPRRFLPLLATSLVLLLGGCGGGGGGGGGSPSRYLALGDSYTSGQSVPPDDRWPVQLAARLKAGGIDVGDPTVIARTGWTTDELSAAMDQADPRGPFDLVSLLIGVNDEFRGGDPAAYRPAFIALLQRAVALAGGRPSHVVVLSIPDWGVTPFAAGRDRVAIARSIDAFNAVSRAESARLGVRYVDVTAESRTAATSPALVAGDGLHPSAAMYQAWADAALPEAKAAVAAR